MKTGCDARRCARVIGYAAICVPDRPRRDSSDLREVGAFVRMRARGIVSGLAAATPDWNKDCAYSDFEVPMGCENGYSSSDFRPESLSWSLSTPIPLPRPVSSSPRSPRLPPHSSCPSLASSSRRSPTSRRPSAPEPSWWTSPTTSPASRRLLEQFSVLAALRQSHGLTPSSTNNNNGFRCARGL